MSSLWMGEDHLVYVKGSGFLLNFTEQYRRFRYRDIQSFTVTPTGRLGGIVLYLLGFLVFASPMGVIVFRRIGTETLGLGSLIALCFLAAGAIIFFGLLTRHWLLGPSCICDLKTNLKQERLAPLNRLYLTNQAIDLISSAVQEKQKFLLNQSDAAGAVNLDSLEKSEKDNLSIGKLVLPAFVIYVFFGLSGLAALHLESMELCGLSLGLIVLGNMFLTNSIARSFRRASPGPIRKLLFVLFSGVMFFGGIATVYFIHIVLGKEAFMLELTGPLEAFAGVSTLGGPVYYLLFLFSILLVFGIAITGLVQTLSWRKWLAQSDSTPEK